MGAHLSRRELLAAAGVGAAGLALRKPGFAATPEQELPGNWEAVRRSFDLDGSNIHMSGFFLAAHPRRVREAIARHRAKLDRDPFSYTHEMMGPGEEESRKSAGKYLNATPQDIALTDSTTMGLATLYHGIRIEPGQKILTTTHDHYSTHGSLELRARRNGIEWRQIPLYADPAKITVEEVVRSLEGQIEPSTRILAVTYVHSSTGVRLPIPRIADVVRKGNEHRSAKDRLVLCVDAVHGFGCTVLDVEKFGADAFAAGCHKWLFGPRGTGVLWARKEIQAYFQPMIPSFSVGEGWGCPMTPGGFHSFEHRWALRDAFDWHLDIGPTRIEARIHNLNRQAKAELAKMPKVKLYTPMADEFSAGIVCFDIEGMKQTEVVERLKQKRILASVTPYRDSYARISPGLLTTPEEVDKTMAAIHDLAP